MKDTQHPSTPHRSAVTMIGLGPMGQAMTRTLLAAGHPVTVWNRTASRTDGVVAEGALLAATPTEAVEASDLVILSLTDYAAMYDVLDEAKGSLLDRTLANLSSDTPDRTREAATWADSHGSTLLTGGVMVPAPMIGTAAAYVYYSGPAEVLDQHREVLELLGTATYLGNDPGLAQLMYQAQLTVFLTTMSALIQATAMLGRAGMKAHETLPELLASAARIGDIIGAGKVNLGTALDAGEHPGHLATITMMGATAAQGDDNWTRIIDGIRDPR